MTRNIAGPKLYKDKNALITEEFEKTIPLLKTKQYLDLKKDSHRRSFCEAVELYKSKDSRDAKIACIQIYGLLGLKRFTESNKPYRESVKIILRKIKYPALQTKLNFL